MANINLVFEVVFHGLIETTSPQLASEPVPQPSSLQLPIDHRVLVFSVFQYSQPAVRSHSGIWGRDLVEGQTRELGLLPSWGSATGSLLLHPHPLLRRQRLVLPEDLTSAHKGVLSLCLSLPSALSLSHTLLSPQQCGSLPARCTASGYLSLLCLADSLLT